VKWSFKLVRIAGIDVMIHWTIAILLFWLATANLIQGKEIVASAMHSADQQNNLGWGPSHASIPLPR
jgi:hypothetical protein